mgnify:CR=1 FL=1
MSIEETYKGMWSSDATLLRSLLDAGNTIIRKHGIGLMPIFVTHFFGEPRYETYDSDWDSQYIDAKDFGSIEFLIPPRPLVLEPKPLEWVKIDEGYFEAKDGAFTYQVDSSGFWSVDNVEYYPNTATDFDTAKAAIHEWRVNHLKSMLP